MTNYKDHLSEGEFNLSQVLANSRLNTEAVLSDVLDVSFGPSILTINGIPNNVNHTMQIMTDGSDVGAFTILVNAAGINIQTGDTMVFNLLSSVVATSLFVHDLWNRLFYAAPHNCDVPWVILGGVGIHDIQTLRLEGTFSLDLFRKRKIASLSFRDHITIPCPMCAKLCIERHLMNRSFGYCSDHGKFDYKWVRFLNFDDEKIFSDKATLLKNTLRGFQNCQIEAIESYNQWFNLGPGLLKDSFIYNEYGLETFFSITSDLKPDPSKPHMAEIPNVSKSQMVDNAINDLKMTKDYITNQGLSLDQLYMECRLGNCSFRTWEQIVLSGLLFNRI